VQNRRKNVFIDDFFKKNFEMAIKKGSENTPNMKGGHDA